MKSDFEQTKRVSSAKGFLGLKNPKKEMRTGFVTGNDGERYEVIRGLKEGDKLLCIKTQRSTSGIGLWSTEKYNSFEVGKVYPVHHITNWSGVMVAYVLDEDSCLTWAEPETFELFTK